MIKIIQANYEYDKVIQVYFSDGKYGDYDLQSVIDKKTVLTQFLEEDYDFQEFYLEMGALCWKNGLQLSPSHIYLKLEQQQLLHTVTVEYVA